MKDLEILTARFAERLNSLMPSLGPLNAIDVHIDEVLGYKPPPEEQIAASVRLLGWIISNLAETLAGKVVMLLIPLRNSPALDEVPPAWDSLASQLSPTPPSIYVMAPTAFLQPDPAERFIAAIEAPLHDPHALAAHYQCWRNPDDPVEDGWARDVRIVFTGFFELDGQRDAQQRWGRGSQLPDATCVFSHSRSHQEPAQARWRLATRRAFGESC